MSTLFCQKCKQEHPDRVCDFEDGECAETRESEQQDLIQPEKTESKMGEKHTGDASGFQP